MRFIHPITCWLKGHNKLLVGTAVGVVVGSVGSAVAFASIPDSSGLIHSCFRPGQIGYIRIIDSATQSCANGETPLTWNQKGAQGPPASGGLVSNLAGANLSGASLPYHNFADQDLHGIKINADDASGVFGFNTAGRTNLIGSDFSGANLSGAFIDGASMIYANASRANFTGATIKNIIAGNRVSLAGSLTNFQNADFTNATFSSSGTIFGGDFQGAKFVGATMVGNFGFQNSNLHAVDFSTMTFQPVGNNSKPSFFSVDLSGANFSGVVLTARIESNNATSANFTNVHFVNSSLVGTDLSSATLTGATWSTTVCPDNTNSDANGNTCIGHLVP
jgi:uncharacterized protein YjbI with pentapeptide repeats